MQAGRVIKFRAWDSERGKMVFPMVMNWWQDEGAPAFKSEFVDCDASHECTSKYLFEVDLMQFTGLRDKNGKEIYEGDVWLLQGSDTPRVIVWHRYGWWFQYPGSAVTKPVEWTEDGEIIGNIYENPELLEVGNDASRT